MSVAALRVSTYSAQSSCQNLWLTCSQPDGSYETCPEGPSTQYLRTLAPQTIQGMVFGTRVLRYWVLGPSGLVLSLNSSRRLNWLFLYIGVPCECVLVIRALLFGVCIRAPDFGNLKTVH